MENVDHRQAFCAAVQKLNSRFAPPAAQKPRELVADPLPSPDLVLSDSQLQTIEEIRDGLVLIAQLEKRMNLLAIQAGLNAALSLPQVGMFWSRIEDRLYVSASAASRLRNGRAA